MLIRITILLLAFGFLAVSHEGNAIAQSIDPAIQGFWFCTDANGRPINRARSTVLLIRDQEFMMLGSSIARSTATYTRGAEQNRIDLDRYDGDKQIGTYMVDGSVLRITLGSPGSSRPDHLRRDQSKASARHTYFTFSRLPTDEGAEVLQHILSDRLSLELIGEPFDLHQQRVSSIR